ncbi:MDR family MFS transporter [Streptomyces griseofuscus]|uniref:MDR family MFS transporter n=1 Tax=Streptomyces griseofuscus TaxID=146922 RepID=UPI003451C25D
MKQRKKTAPHHGLLLVAILGGMFLSMLDQTIVGTALPRIIQDLGGDDLYTWTVTAYLLASTVTVPLYGRLSDIYGRKRLLIIGMVVFLAGSALCALSQNMGELIAFRGLQGLGAGALMPLSLAMVADTVPPERRSQAQGAVGGVMALSYVVGPYLGGVFTDHASWHWVFLVNLPIGAVVLGIIWRLLPGGGGIPDAGRPDYAGIGVLSVGISSLLIGLTMKGVDGHTWTDGVVLGPILLAALLLVPFILIENRADQPIMPLGLFRNRAYTLVNAASFFSAFCLFAAVVFLPRFFQEALGHSASSSGLHLYPLMIAMVTGSLLAATMIRKSGGYKIWLLGGTVLAGAGAALFTRLALDTPLLTMSLWMLLIGLGIGPMLSGLTIVIQANVGPADLGTASSNITFFRQIGGSIALAIGGSLYADAVTGHIHDGMRQAQAAGTASALPWLSVIGAAAAFLAVLFLPAPRRNLDSEATREASLVALG